MIHISTDETFLIESPEVELECPICGKSCIQRCGWIGAKCSNCNVTWNLEDTGPDIVKKRRMLMNLTRKQFGLLLGYKRSTIKRYEYVQCSKPYYEKTLTLIKNNFK